MAQNNNPETVAITRGAVENAQIPSIAYKSKLNNDHFVLPATRCLFSTSNHLVLNPTKLNKPFEYLLYSFNDSTAFTTCLVINR